MTMDQPQSRRPASGSRPARRSLAEFALPAVGVPADPPSAAQPLPIVQPAPVTQRDKQTVKPSDKRGETTMHQPLNEDQRTAARELRQANERDGEMLEDNALFQPFDDITSAAAKAAKDYRSWMLEHMKISLCAALDYANGLTSAASRTNSESDRDTPEQAKSTGSQSIDKTTPTVAKLVDEYRAGAFELMTANVGATLEYARGLVNATTPSEFIELSMSHACRQLEMMVKQTARLGSIARRLTTSNVVE
jgi:phasin protein